MTDYYNGVQKIVQRHEPCRCGCQGRDPWHKRELPRVVRNVQCLAEPRHLFGEVWVIATGEYKHPSGEFKACELWAHPKGDGAYWPITWRATKKRYIE